MIRVGIVGTGNIVGISHFHALGLMRDGRAEISAVYDVRIDGARKWCNEHKLSAKVCCSYEELLDEVDAVNICVPNSFHFGYAIKAIEAGKHFLVEKPMAVTIEECRNLAEKTKLYDKVNMVGFVYRYSKAVQIAKKFVSEKLGKIYTYTSWFGGKRLANPQIGIEWRMLRQKSGSGALGDFGSHLIDLADFIAGQRYTSVCCMLEKNIPIREGKEVENDDSSVFIAKGHDGIGSYTVSRTGMDDIMVLVTGEGGMIQISLRNPISIIYWEKNIYGAYTGCIEKIEIPPETPFEGWFDNEMSEYLDAIEGKTKVYPNVAQGLYVEEVLHAAEIAANTGKEEGVRT